MGADLQAANRRLYFFLLVLAPDLAQDQRLGSDRTELGIPRRVRRVPCLLRTACVVLGLTSMLICSWECFAQSPDPYRLDGDRPSAESPQETSGNPDPQPKRASDQVPDDTESGSTDPEESKGSDTDSNDPKAAVENSISETAAKAKETANRLAKGDLSGAAESGWTLVVRYGVPAIVALLLLIVAYMVASFLARICSMPVRRRVDETLGRFIAKLVFYGVMVCALLGVLQYFGIGVTSFAAVVAAAGFAIGLAFQGTLANFAAGVMLLVFRPFKVGDVVNAAGLTAKIYEIDLFNTVFDTFDNRRIIVPNGVIVAGTIENISHHEERRVDVAVGVEYSASIAQTRQTLEAASESLNEFVIEGEGRGYQVVLGDLGDSSVQWTVRFWTQAENFLPVKEKLTEAVKNHLDAAGIGIPFPQLDVHLNRTDN